MAILSFLLPIFFLLIGFGEMLRVKFLFVASTGIIDVAVLALVLVWLIFIKKSKKYELGKAILIFILIAFFSLIINIFNYSSNQLLISSMYLVRFAAYSLLYFVFVDIGKTFNKLIPKYMFMTGLIFITFGYFQFFLFPSLKGEYFLGWDMHEYRLFSTLFDPNFAGVLLVLIFIFIFNFRDSNFFKKMAIFSSNFFNI